MRASLDTISWSRSRAAACSASIRFTCSSTRLPASLIAVSFYVGSVASPRWNMHFLHPEAECAAAFLPSPDLGRLESTGTPRTSALQSCRNRCRPRTPLGAQCRSEVENFSHIPGASANDVGLAAEVAAFWRPRKWQVAEHLVAHRTFCNQSRTALFGLQCLLWVRRCPRGRNTRRICDGSGVEKCRVALAATSGLPLLHFICPT